MAFNLMKKYIVKGVIVKKVIAIRNIVNVINQEFDVQNFASAKIVKIYQILIKINSFNNLK